MDSLYFLHEPKSALQFIDCGTTPGHLAVNYITVNKCRAPYKKKIYYFPFLFKFLFTVNPLMRLNIYLYLTAFTILLVD